MGTLQIIVGSTRLTRAADLVLPWVLGVAEANPAFDVEVLDLRDWPLPMFGEHMGSIGDFRNPSYSEPIVKRWNETVKQGDAYLVITPEYNHSVPGVLKNAFDNVFVSFALRNKPVASIGYSTGVAAGARAIEHLAHIIIEADAVPLRNTVLIPFVATAFVDGVPKDPMTQIALDVVLQDLEWWSRNLARARAEGELVPGVRRARDALAALAERA
ncbi:MAG TPA: NAD(P)H-dependent oxidoreductase [Acidimicrobiales bacterium]|nr:NAD(P)H-dependent oxidoreductase [Acidimicrobiales bacterium]